MGKNKTHGNKGFTIAKRAGVIALGIIGILITAPYSPNKDVHMKGGSVGITGRWGIASFCIIIILIAVLYKKPKRQQNISLYETTICPECGKVYIVGSGPTDDICTKCTVKLEPLEGFYDRHPEQKEVEEILPKKIEDIE
ncbi:hypothetical protein [Maridesulfovibrio frigidus]|uniref:hypothetical protein n=1 Tax=Maridesulfovibrio frigidus TaxID=340956 RepID=UPI0004E1EB7D|nr:hypothetical protein [Maridesulfovibrio frigidus]